MNNKRLTLLIVCLFTCIFSYGMEIPVASSSTKATTPHSIHQAIFDAITAVDGPKGYVLRDKVPEAVAASAKIESKCQAAIKYIMTHQRKINEKNWKNQTPLHVVLSECNPYYYAHYNQAIRQNIAQCLIETGANLSATDEQENTPLHVAAREDWPTVVGLILCCGDQRRKCKMRNNHGQTPLHLASTSDVAALLIPHTQIDEVYANHLFHIAATKNWVSVLEAIFTKSIDRNSRLALCNAPDENRKTPLHLAIERNAFDAAEWLLNQDANPTALDSDGRTPMSYADCHFDNQPLKDFIDRHPELKSSIAQSDLEKINQKKLSPKKELFGRLQGYDKVCKFAERVPKQAKRFSKKYTPIIQQSLQTITAGTLGAWALGQLIPSSWGPNLLDVGAIISSMAIIGSHALPLESIIRWGHQKLQPGKEPSPQQFSQKYTPIIRRYMQAIAAGILGAWTLSQFLPSSASASMMSAGKNLLDVGAIISSMALIGRHTLPLQSIFRWGHQIIRDHRAQTYKHITKKSLMQNFEMKKDKFDKKFADYLLSCTGMMRFNLCIF